MSGDGLVYGHAYSLLDVVDNVAGTGIDLVQLRNPWGSGEWTGDWSDNSPKWRQYPQVKAALHEVARDDGIFWMEKKDFCDRYDSIFVCLSAEAIAERQKWRSKQASTQPALFTSSHARSQYALNFDPTASPHRPIPEIYPLLRRPESRRNGPKVLPSFPPTAWMLRSQSGPS